MTTHNLRGSHVRAFGVDISNTPKTTTQIGGGPLHSHSHKKGSSNSRSLQQPGVKLLFGSPNDTTNHAAAAAAAHEDTNLASEEDTPALILTWPALATPWVDFGRTANYAKKTLHIQNPSSTQPQVVCVDVGNKAKASGFDVVGARELEVAPNGTVNVTLAWTPTYDAADASKNNLKELVYVQWQQLDEEGDVVNNRRLEIKVCGVAAGASPRTARRVTRSMARSAAGANSPPVAAALGKRRMPAVTSLSRKTTSAAAKKQAPPPPSQQQQEAPSAKRSKGEMGSAIPRPTSTIARQRSAPVPVASKLRLKKSRSSTATTSSSSSSSATRQISASRPAFGAFHAELWMRKQERAFAGWLNEILAPQSCSATTQTASSTEAAPSAHATAMSHRRLVAKTRGLLWRLYSQGTDTPANTTGITKSNASSIIPLLLRMESSIDKQRLALSESSSLMTDIRLRDNAHAGVLAYHPFWLKLALEVVVGDDAARLRPATADESDEDSAAHAELVAFVKHRFFADPELSKNYQSVPGVENGLHKDGYVVALRALVLKRVLLLALVLDRAVQSQYKPIGCPPLFRVQRRSDDAAAAVLLKRSSDVVVQCLSESVAGSGDVLRHLKVNFKYTLSHEQTSIMEANFAVSNVATDLRDGMRLCKLVDALASTNPPAMDGVKYPADKRALQLHNVSLALASFKACGSSVVSPTSSEEAYAREIVDGHRETTLAVLWSIYAEHQVSRLVCTPEVSHDTLTVLETWIASKHRAEAAKVGTGLARYRSRAVQAQERQQAHLTARLPSYIGEATMEIGESSAKAFHAVFQWFYGHSLLTGFAEGALHTFQQGCGDGYLLCHVVAHYAPSLLDADEVYRPPRALLRMKLAEWVASASAPDGIGAVGDEDVFVYGANAKSATEDDAPLSPEPDVPFVFNTGSAEEDAARTAAHQRGVARNFALLRTAFETMGGVPSHALTSDDAFDGTQLGADEKAAAVLVSMLCARLLEVSKEHRAACCMQRVFRAKLRLKRAPGQSAARLHLHMWQAAAAVIERFWVGYKVKCAFRTAQRAAVAIQSRVRSFLAQRKYTRFCSAMISIQSLWRGQLARRDFMWNKTVPRVLAKGLLRARAMRASRRLARRTPAAVRIQTAARRFLCRSRYQRLTRAITTLQHLWRTRGDTSRATFMEMRKSAVILQRGWRAQKAYRVHVARVRNAAATKIQASSRGWHVRKRLAKERGEAQNLICIVAAQALVRGFLVRSRARRAAVAVARRQEAEKAAVCIQAAARGIAARRNLQLMQNAATTVQCALRRHAFNKRVAHREHAACINAAATKMQSLCRGFLARTVVGRMRAELVIREMAAMTVQAAMRGRLARIEASRMRAEIAMLKARESAAVTVQAAMRGRLARIEASRMRAEIAMLKARESAAVTVQAAMRGRLARIEASRMRAEIAMLKARESAAVTVQAAMRGRLARIEASRMRAEMDRMRALWEVARNMAATTLQAAMRGRLARIEASRIRAEIAMLKARESAAVTVQAAMRGRLARIEASRIRAEIAMLKARESAAVTVQAAMRGRIARIEASRMRAEIAMLKARESAAALTIQSLFRGHVARMKSKSIRIQNAVKEVSCVRMQAAFRGLVARRKAEMERAAVVRLQSAVRGFHVRAEFTALRSSRAKMAQASTLLQSAARGFLVRRALMRQSDAARQIQAAMRGHVARLEVARMRAELATLRESAAIAIQSAMRGRLRARRMQAELAVQRETSAIAIQAAMRGRVARLEVARMRAELAVQRETSAIAIQAAMRGRVARLEVARMRTELAVQRETSAIAIQAAMRGRVARLEVARMRAELAVQRETSAIAIQAAMRGWQVRKNLVKIELAAIEIQRRTRGILARARASVVREEAMRRARTAAATAATLPAAERLGKRTMWALSILSSSQDLVHLGEACDALVECCSTGGATCQSLVAGNGGVDMLLRYVRSCGRSESHLSLLSKCLTVLRVCAMPSAPSAVHIARARACVPILLEQMQACRDKPLVFDAACEVLVLLAQNASCRTIAFAPSAAPANATVTPARANSGGFDAETIKRLALMHGILSKRHTADSQWLARMSSARTARGVAAAEAAKQKLAACAGSIKRVEALLDALGVDASAREMLATPATPAVHRTPLTVYKSAAPMSTLRRRRTPSKEGGVGG
ncbi:abnormal spindle-like microcephaly-associated protein-like protein [Pseudoscourfieldia marina]